MKNAQSLIPIVERWLDTLYIAAEGAALRREDRRKAIEVASLLVEIEQMIARFSAREPVVLVDTAAGKSYVGLLAAKLVLESLGRPGTVVTIEREADRVAAGRAAADRMQSPVTMEFRGGDVGNPDCWPDRPTLVCALHACGAAADRIIDRAISCEARSLLLVPCCTGEGVEAADLAERKGVELGIPRHAPVRRRFIQAAVDAERTWRLEAAGYETEVVEFVAATVTPHNLLWRARRVCEPRRMEAARSALRKFRE